MKKIFLLTFSIVFLAAVVSCTNGSNAASKIKKENILNAQKRDKDISKGAAVASFDKTEYDFGTIKQGDVVHTSFTLFNKGKTDLVITNIKTTCGCTVPKWSRDPIAPGKSSEIKVKFNSAGKRGKQVKTITMFTNTEKGREIVKLIGMVETKPVQSIK